MTGRISGLTPEEEEAALRMFAASHVRNEALVRKRRFEAGEFSIDLVPDPDERAADDPDFQKGLSSFGVTVHAAGVPVSQTAIAFDSVDAHGYPLPEFIVAFKVLGPPAITALAAAAGAWVQARYGRKVRLNIGKNGDVDAEGRSVAEIEELLKVAAKFQDRDQDTGDEQ
jgi:hypothetical protein